MNAALRPLVLALAALAACTPVAVYVPAKAPALGADTSRVASVPRFIVTPALDRRPPAEVTGRGAEYGLVVSTVLSGNGKWEQIDYRRASGASVFATEGMRWTPLSFTLRPGLLNVSVTLTPSLTSVVASDVGSALAGAANRPVVLMPGAPALAVASAEDGSVLVTVIVDHIAQIEPVNAHFVGARTEDRYGRRTAGAVESNDQLGKFWTVAFQIELAEVRGHRIARRLVRYAAATSDSPDSYATAIAAAAGEVVDAVATEWVPSSSVASR